MGRGSFDEMIIFNVSLAKADIQRLMNKGLEVIEAYWLFNIPIEKIEIIIHPESILHSMVEFIDGSIKGQLGFPDMKIPIAYGLGFPNRIDSFSESLDLEKISQLNFIKTKILLKNKPIA